MHAGYHAGTFAVDRLNSPVGDGAAQDSRVQHAVTRQIIDELSASSEEPGVLDTFDGAADQTIYFTHVTSPQSRPAPIPIESRYL